MLMSTTSVIPGYRITRHGCVAWGSGYADNLCDAVSNAIEQLRINAENNGHNAIVGITHSATYDSDAGKFVVSAMGTEADVEEE